MDGLVLLVGLYTERRGWSALCPSATRCVAYITAYTLGAAFAQPSVLWPTQWKAYIVEFAQSLRI